MPGSRTIPNGIVAVAALLVAAFLTVPTSAPEAFPTSSLSCTKTADPTNIVLPAGPTTVTHTIGVKVNGSRTLNNVTIEDALGTDVAYVSDDSTCSYSAATNVVTCNVGTLAGGGTATVNIVVDLAAVTADQVTNVATVSSPDTTRGGSCQDDVTITRIVEEPLLACLGKNVTDPSSGVLDEGVTKIVTYEISIQNQGDGTATNVDVSDIFTVDQAIEFVSAAWSDNGGSTAAECFIDGSGTAASDGDAIMNSSDVVCDIGDIGTGVTRTLTLQVRVINPVAGQEFSNSAVADADNTDPTTQTCEETLTVQSTPDGDEGCTPGYWKNDADKRGAEHWTDTGYDPADGLSVVDGAACLPNAVFDPDFNGNGDPSWWTCNLDGDKGDTEIDDLLNALAFPGDCGPTDNCDKPGAARILLRAAVAALLNAASPDVNYPRSESDIIMDTEDAIASMNRNVMLGLARGLDIDNNLGCPLPAFE